MSLSKSSLALQWSIEDLLTRSTSPCGFYLITCAVRLDWKEFSRRHAKMLDRMRTDAWKRKLRRFGGVRVFEEGEETFRPHAHWVMCPRIPQAVIQHYADLAGMGHVWLDFRPASEYLGMYLSKYLSKNKRALHGVRRWSCFGEFSSTKVADVEVSSPEIELFRSHMKQCLAEGMGKSEAYTETVRRCNCSKYGVPYNKESKPENIREVKPDLQIEHPNGDVFPINE